MHSIAMPSSPAFLTIFSFITSLTSCCPFLPLIPLQSPLKKTRYPDATIYEVPFLLVSCSPITSKPFAARGFSRVSMWPIPVTPLIAALQTSNVPNVSSSSRDLDLAALCFMRAAFLHPLPPSLFPSKCPPPFAQLHVEEYSTQILVFVLPKHWVWHSHHAMTSISSTLSLTRVYPPSTPPLLASDPTFSAAAVSQLARLPRETISLCKPPQPTSATESASLPRKTCRHRDSLSSVLLSLSTIGRLKAEKKRLFGNTGP